MIINSKGYDLNFVQIRKSKDESKHILTYIYKFKSSINGMVYILRAELHTNNVFAVKFYCKQQAKSDYKYSKITNKGDVYNIFVTIAKVIPILLEKYPDASFAFTGARSIDLRSRRIEDYENNQRFRVYKEIVNSLIGNKTFTHYEYNRISAYLLINNLSLDIERREREIVKMFAETYVELSEII